MLCHYGERHYAECGILFIIMLSKFTLSVVMLSVVAPMLTDVMSFPDKKIIFHNFSTPVPAQ
jgi:hypothetical protein